jgi:hypothetical protein
MVEFVFAGIASAVLMLSTVQVAIAMWNYHTLAYAVHETNRYISSHGRDCELGGNSCTITVATVVSKLETNAIGLAPANISLTLTPNSGSGDAVTCNPITTCSSSSTQWPPITSMDNWATQPPSSPTYSTIKATYTFNSAIVALWFGWKGKNITSVTLTSQSQVPMLF